MLVDANSTLALLRMVNASTRIAVVGSSGNLLGSGYGASIEGGHDLIIRTNSATTAGYEADVGARTDVVIGTAWGFEDRDPGAPPPTAFNMLVATLDSTDKTAHSLRHLEALQKEQDAHVPIAVIAYGWAHNLRAAYLESIGGELPSTGFVAIATAVALASHVGAPPPSIFGFGAAECFKYYCPCQGDATRQCTFNEGEQHAANTGTAFNMEAKVRSQWEDAKLIRVWGGKK